MVSLFVNTDARQPFIAQSTLEFLSTNLNPFRRSTVHKCLSIYEGYWSSLVYLRAGGGKSVNKFKELNSLWGHVVVIPPLPPKPPKYVMLSSEKLNTVVNILYIFLCALYIPSGQSRERFFFHFLGRTWKKKNNQMWL